MRLIICTIAVLFCFLTAQAQLSFGVRGGVINTNINYSQLSASEVLDNRTGLLGGLLAEIRANEGFAIQPEINYVQRNWQYTQIINVPFILETKNIQEFKVQYVEIPLLLKAGFKLGPARFDLVGGPAFSWAIGGTKKETTINTSPITGGSDTQITKEDMDFENDYKKTDLNVQGGAMLSFKVLESRFFIDGRYIYGLTPLDNFDYVNIENRGISLSAGLIFGF
jgi:Outer membrane protein beta-barrel domain